MLWGGFVCDSSFRFISSDAKSWEDGVIIPFSNISQRFTENIFLFITYTHCAVFGFFSVCVFLFVQIPSGVLTTQTLSFIVDTSFRKQVKERSPLSKDVWFSWQSPVLSLFPVPLLQASHSVQQRFVHRRALQRWMRIGLQWIKWVEIGKQDIYINFLLPEYILQDIRQVIYFLILTMSLSLLSMITPRFVFLYCSRWQTVYSLKTHFWLVG